MIKTGVVGGGTNSAVGMAHISAMRMTGLYEVVCGVFSRRPDVNAESSLRYGCACYDEIASLARRRVDRLVVLSPTPSHAAHIKECASYAMPILCEKALCSTSKEIEAVQQFTAPLACVFNYAYYPAVQRLRRVMSAGGLGRVTHIRVEMPQAGYLHNAPQAWRVSDNGIYLDLGVHLHHLIWALTGEAPLYVTAIERKYSHLDIVDYVDSQIEYDTFNAHMWFSKCSYGHTNGLRICVYGDRGSAEWYQRTPDLLKMNGAETVEVANPRFKTGHPTGYVEALANLYEDWAVSTAPPMLSPAVAYEGLRLMEAMRKSAEIGSTVSVI